MSKKIKEPTTAELLVELGTFDEVEASAVTEVEHRALPAWTEIILGAQRSQDWPTNIKVPLTRHDAELFIEVLHDVLHPNAGGSILDAIWHDLDECMDRIMRRVNKGKEPLKADVGEARGLTKAVARMTNPYSSTNAYEVTKGIAMDRYAVRHGLPTDSEDD